jgi:hypothetical protein
MHISLGTLRHQSLTTEPQPLHRSPTITNSLKRDCKPQPEPQPESTGSPRAPLWSPPRCQRPWFETRLTRLTRLGVPLNNLLASDFPRSPHTTHFVCIACVIPFSVSLQLAIFWLLAAGLLVCWLSRVHGCVLIRALQVCVALSCSCSPLAPLASWTAHITSFTPRYPSIASSSVEFRTPGAGPQ